MRLRASKLLRYGAKTYAACGDGSTYRIGRFRTLSDAFGLFFRSGGKISTASGIGRLSEASQMSRVPLGNSRQ